MVVIATATLGSSLISRLHPPLLCLQNSAATSSLEERSGCIAHDAMREAMEMAKKAVAGAAHNSEVTKARRRSLEARRNAELQHHGNGDLSEGQPRRTARRAGPPHPSPPIVLLLHGHPPHFSCALTVIHEISTSSAPKFS